MNRKRLTGILGILLLLLIFSGCGAQVKYQIPHMEAQAVPDLQLDERPALTITDQEAAALQQWNPVVTGKIMKYVLAVEGYEDIADDVVKGYRKFILNLFTEEKTKAKKQK